MLDDYLRPWKGYQIQAVKIKREVLSGKIADLDKNLNIDELKGLDQKKIYLTIY